MQSMSHWAPANIGPYSQAVRVRKPQHAGGLNLVVVAMMLNNLLIHSAFITFSSALRKCPLSSFLRVALRRYVPD